jgi:hypothetical protein
VILANKKKRYFFYRAAELSFELLVMDEGANIRYEKKG